MEALRDRRRRLRGPAIAFHPDRPGLGLRAVGLAKRLVGRLARVFGADSRAHDRTRIDRLARLRAHGARLQPRFRRRATPLGLEVRDDPTTLRLRSCAPRLRRRDTYIRVGRWKSGAVWWSRLFSRHHPPTGRRKAPPDDRLRRVIQYSRPVVMESRSRSVLDTRVTMISARSVSRSKAAARQRSWPRSRAISDRSKSVRRSCSTS